MIVIRNFENVHLNNKKVAKPVRRTLAAFTTLVFSVFFLFQSADLGYGFSIQLAGKIEFADKSELQTIPISFCVTEDGLYLIPDYDTRTIKIFDKVEKYLKLVKEFGPKGFGSAEFDDPRYCFYNKNENIFSVTDAGLRRVFFFDRIGKLDFKLVRTVPNVDAHDIKPAGDGKNLIVCGYITDSEKRSYELYSINLENPNQKNYLLPSYKKYHLPSDKEYKIEYSDKQTLASIGIRAYIDVQKDEVYFVWEGKLRIIKINLKTKTEITFGHKTEHYKEPFVSAELIKAYSDKDYTKAEKARNKMSFVRGIFATSRHVLVVYEGPNQANRNFRLQMYTAEGKFLGDVVIPDDYNSPYHRQMLLYKGKGNYKLYSFLKTTNRENQILIYNVSEWQ
ncbi:MAG: hypothetical protein PVH61_31985 [Candidatus Aminicenantes bacterium]|jgi:hypothetical protein